MFGPVSYRLFNYLKIGNLTIDIGRRSSTFLYNISFKHISHPTSVRQIQSAFTHKHTPVIMRSDELHVRF